MKVRYLMMIFLSIHQIHSYDQKRNNTQTKESMEKEISAIRKKRMENITENEMSRLVYLDDKLHQMRLDSAPKELLSLIKKDTKTLTLAEMRRINHLFNELGRKNKDLAIEIDEEYQLDVSSACDDITPFRERWYRLELDSLFHKPNIKDKTWNNDAKNWLTKFYYSANQNSCGDRSQLNEAKKYIQRYEKIIGKKFTLPPYSYYKSLAEDMWREE